MTFLANLDGLLGLRFSEREFELYVRSGMPMEPTGFEQSH